MTARSDIRDNIRIVRQERNQKMNELMKEYDTTIYKPSIQALQDECEKLGHIPGALHNNGLSNVGYFCRTCEKMIFNQ